MRGAAISRRDEWRHITDRVDTPNCLAAEPVGLALLLRELVASEDLRPGLERVWALAEPTVGLRAGHLYDALRDLATCLDLDTHLPLPEGWPGPDGPTFPEALTAMLAWTEGLECRLDNAGRTVLRLPDQATFEADPRTFVEQRLNYYPATRPPEGATWRVEELSVSEWLLALGRRLASTRHHTLSQHRAQTEREGAALLGAPRPPARAEDALPATQRARGPDLRRLR